MNGKYVNVEQTTCLNFNYVEIRLFFTERILASDSTVLHTTDEILKIVFSAGGNGLKNI